MTEQDYLAFDRAAEFRREFLNGEIIERQGASLRHAALQVGLVREIHAQLRGTSCELFGSDLRLRVSSRMYSYPDRTGVCGKPKILDERDDVLLNPTVLFEVLSPSTEHYDRGMKFRGYREIPSLTDYILVDPDQIRIEQFTRGDANTWTLRDHLSAEDVLRIPSISVSVPLAALYERIEFPAE